MKKDITDSFSIVAAFLVVMVIFLGTDVFAAKTATLTAAQNWNDTQWTSACVNNKNAAGKYISTIEMCPQNGVTGVVEICKTVVEENTTLSWASGFVNHMIQSWNSIYPGYEP